MDTIFEGLQVMVIGMGVVFVVLFSLTLVLRAFEAFLYKEKKIKKPSEDYGGKPKRVQESVAAQERLDEVAVITTVLYDFLDQGEKIINIRQIN
ncbi:MAG TPA: OadG family protein [Halanaerobiales bacterium]|nr:OadG family protein [Halanaerobiales bacterium]